VSHREEANNLSAHNTKFRDCSGWHKPDKQGLKRKGLFLLLFFNFTAAVLFYSTAASLHRVNLCVCVCV